MLRVQLQGRPYPVLNVFRHQPMDISMVGLCMFVPEGVEKCWQQFATRFWSTNWMVRVLFTSIDIHWYSNWRRYGHGCCSQASSTQNTTSFWTIILAAIINYQTWLTSLLTITLPCLVAKWLGCWGNMSIASLLNPAQQLVQRGPPGSKLTHKPSRWMTAKCWLVIVRRLWTYAIQYLVWS